MEKLSKIGIFNQIDERYNPYKDQNDPTAELMDRKLVKTGKNYIKDLKRYSSNREIINNVF
jgi:hypothetical protein